MLSLHESLSSIPNAKERKEGKREQEKMKGIEKILSNVSLLVLNYSSIEVIISDVLLHSRVTTDVDNIMYFCLSQYNILLFFKNFIHTYNIFWSIITSMPPPTLSRSTTHSQIHSNFMALLFLKPIVSNLCYPYPHGYRAIHWNTGDLSEVTPLKKTDSPPPESINLRLWLKNPSFSML